GYRNVITVEAEQHGQARGVVGFVLHHENPQRRIPLPPGVPSVEAQCLIHLCYPRCKEWTVRRKPERWRRPEPGRSQGRRWQTWPHETEWMKTSLAPPSRQAANAEFQFSSGFRNCKGKSRPDERRISSPLPSRQRRGVTGSRLAATPGPRLTTIPLAPRDR